MRNTPKPVIIPYQELSGSYNRRWVQPAAGTDYTIPRTVRELQPTMGTACGRYRLYHTKNCQGATTPMNLDRAVLQIIPYQELSGSYNNWCASDAVIFIIPYQELSGSYNYRLACNLHLADYTIPRTVRELQRSRKSRNGSRYYTIPRTVRELQLDAGYNPLLNNYTIPRTVRELRPKTRTRFRHEYYTIPSTVSKTHPYNSI